MKTAARKITGVFLSVILTAATAAAAVPAANAAQETSAVTLSFYGDTNMKNERDVLNQYVCRDNKTVKLINDRTLYSYSTATDTFTVEYTFPEQEGIRQEAPQSGSFSVVRGIRSAYVNENTGLLYYAFDKYRLFNKTEGMMVEVIIYDLERGKVVSTLDVEGENLSCVGGDDSGNIYLSVQNRVSSLENKAGVRVYSANGVRSASLDLDTPVDTFCAFLDGGKFYYASTVYTPAEQQGYYYVNRALHSGTYQNSTLTLSDLSVGYLNDDYHQPAKMVGDYLATYTVRLYDTQTDKPVAYFAGTPDYEENYNTLHSGVNAYIDGNDIYVLETANRIKCYDMASNAFKSAYTTDKNIFSFIKCGNGFLALTKDGDSYSYLSIPFGAFEAVETKRVDLNEQPNYQRSKADIVKRFSESVPQDYTAAFYETTGSVDAPYREYVLTEETKQNAVRTASYYRWLEGLSGFASADDVTWSNAYKGAVLTDKNVRLTGSLSHYPNKPEDMDEDFYNAGYAATSSSNISYGYGDGQYAIPDLLRGFLNDEKYTIPGHRDTFFTRNGISFAAGYTPFAAVNTVKYTDNPNAQGNSVVGNNQPAYAWPAPGYFPMEDISTTAVWTINLNTDYVKLSPQQAVVKITDLDTGEEFVRDSNETGLYATNSWGLYISFKPPGASSYRDKRYHVEVSNLFDGDGAPLVLEYTVNFFSYSDQVEWDGKTYTADRYGRLTEVESQYTLGDVNEDGRVTISDVTAIQRYIAELGDLSRAQFLAADVDKNGEVTIEDATRIQQYLAEYFDEL